MAKDILTIQKTTFYIKGNAFCGGSWPLSPSFNRLRCCQRHNINNGNMVLHLQQSLTLSLCKLRPRKIYTGHLFSRLQVRAKIQNTMSTVTSLKPIIHPTIESIRSMRKTLTSSTSVGFVPTMGALHEGTYGTTLLLGYDTT